MYLKRNQPIEKMKHLELLEFFECHKARKESECDLFESTRTESQKSCLEFVRVAVLVYAAVCNYLRRLEGDTSAPMVRDGVLDILADWQNRAKGSKVSTEAKGYLSNELGKMYARVQSIDVQPEPELKDVAGLIRCDISEVSGCLCGYASISYSELVEKLGPPHYRADPALRTDDDKIDVAWYFKDDTGAGFDLHNYCNGPVYGVDNPVESITRWHVSGRDAKSVAEVIRPHLGELETW